MEMRRTGALIKIFFKLSQKQQPKVISIRRWGSQHAKCQALIARLQALSKGEEGKSLKHSESSFLREILGGKIEKKHKKKREINEESA